MVFEIQDLEFDEENLLHLARHGLTDRRVLQILESEDYVALRRDYNLSQGEALMRKKQPGLRLEEDWEVVHDIVVRKPLGVVLSVRLDHPELDQIARAAESLGLTSLEFVREAALLVATDRSLWHRLSRS